jgi:poly [ADP-ribose] polymerase
MSAPAKASPPKAPQEIASAVVDKHCELSSSDYHVLVSKKRSFSCLLNQTNSANNNNKFYVLQILENTNKNSWHVFRRWGRVGLEGQTKLEQKISPAKAADAFKSLYLAKSGNEWGAPFKPVQGKYSPIIVEADQDEAMADRMDYDGDESSSGLMEVEVESQLPPKLLKLLRMFCDKKKLQEVLKEHKIDSERAPLGKLSANQIRRGYELLERIEFYFKQRSTQSSGSNSINKLIAKLSDQFYTNIPHNFGMSRPPVIEDQSQLDEKLRLLEDLKNIDVAARMLSGTDNRNSHPIDRCYSNLDCTLRALEAEGGKSTHHKNVFF